MYSHVLTVHGCFGEKGGVQRTPTVRDNTWCGPHKHNTINPPPIQSTLKSATTHARHVAKQGSKQGCKQKHTHTRRSHTPSQSHSQPQARRLPSAREGLGCVDANPIHAGGWHPHTILSTRQPTHSWGLATPQQHLVTVSAAALTSTINQLAPLHRVNPNTQQTPWSSPRNEQVVLSQPTCSTSRRPPHLFFAHTSDPEEVMYAGVTSPPTCLVRVSRPTSNQAAAWLLHYHHCQFVQSLQQHPNHMHTAMHATRCLLQQNTCTLMHTKQALVHACAVAHACTQHIWTPSAACR
jgi:hypothetical protein